MLTAWTHSMQESVFRAVRRDRASHIKHVAGLNTRGAETGQGSPADAVRTSSYRTPKTAAIGGRLRPLPVPSGPVPDAEILAMDGMTWPWTA
ncbi:hypothetical protein CTRI78_v009811 [Colletotrichum trifolii]|uniref:Uncharacterized protein n=1 Tax=Colletotrichum trifolii TaxID=5466 RepID=A0A4R8QU82_COLTR|nr:hypothetical protein CTRI78_v009811 [Colletotrichum trifolii]